MVHYKQMGDINIKVNERIIIKIIIIYKKFKKDKICLFVILIVVISYKNFKI